MKTDKFDILLPLYAGSGPVHVKRNGEEMQGVTDVTVRAGVNGHTNVIIGVAAPTSLSCLAASILSPRIDEESATTMGRMLIDTIDGLTDGDKEAALKDPVIMGEALVDWLGTAIRAFPVPEEN